MVASSRPGHEAGVPPRRPAAGGRGDPGQVVAAADEEPRRERVGVPHVAGVLLVQRPGGGAEAAAPGRAPARRARRRRSPARGCPPPRRRRGSARRASTAPRSGTARTGRATGGRPAPRRPHRAPAPACSRPAPSRSPSGRGRGGPRARSGRGRRPRSVLAARGERLEGPTVQPHAPPAGAERQPVEVDADTSSSPRRGVLPVMASSSAPVDRAPAAPGRAQRPALPAAGASDDRLRPWTTSPSSSSPPAAAPA